MNRLFMDYNSYNFIDLLHYSDWSSYPHQCNKEAVVRKEIQNPLIHSCI